MREQMLFTPLCHYRLSKVTFPPHTSTEGTIHGTKKSPRETGKRKQVRLVLLFSPRKDFFEREHHYSLRLARTFERRDFLLRQSDISHLICKNVSACNFGLCVVFFYSFDAYEQSNVSRRPFFSRGLLVRLSREHCLRA